MGKIYDSLSWCGFASGDILIRDFLLLLADGFVGGVSPCY